MAEAKRGQTARITMADILSGSMVNTFMDGFNSMANSKGVLAVRDLGKLLRKVGENPSQAEVQALANQVDKDGTGIIRFPAFLDLMATKVDSLVAEGEIREAFRVFDIDGNGFVTRTELKHVMMNLGEKMTEEEVYSMVEEADIDGDGQINYEEFYGLMNSARRL